MLEMNNIEDVMNATIIALHALVASNAIGKSNPK